VPEKQAGFHYTKSERADAPDDPSFILYSNIRVFQEIFRIICKTAEIYPSDAFLIASMVSTIFTLMESAKA